MHSCINIKNKLIYNTNIDCSKKFPTFHISKMIIIFKADRKIGISAPIIFFISYNFQVHTAVCRYITQLSKELEFTFLICICDTVIKFAKRRYSLKELHTFSVHFQTTAMY